MSGSALSWIIYFAYLLKLLEIMSSNDHCLYFLNFQIYFSYLTLLIIIKIKINISIHKGNPIISEAESLDPKTATVDCIEKPIDQLRKSKTQLHLTK